MDVANRHEATGKRNDYIPILGSEPLLVFLLFLVLEIGGEEVDLSRVSIEIIAVLPGIIIESVRQLRPVDSQLLHLRLSVDFRLKRALNQDRLPQVTGNSWPAHCK